MSEAKFKAKHRKIYLILIRF